MKRPVSILFFFIFLLHVGAFYFISITWRLHARVEMANRLDANNYAAEETITIKLPFNLPYQTEGKAFERMRGEFEYQGEFYKFISQKVERDTLFIVAIKDVKEKTIFNFMTDLVKISSDLPASSNALKLLNTFTKDYISSASIVILSQSGWSSDLVFAERNLGLVTNCLPVYSPPPEKLLFL